MGDFRVDVECEAGHGELGHNHVQLEPTATVCTEDGGSYTLNGCDDTGYCTNPENYDQYIINTGAHGGKSLKKSHFDVTAECADGYGGEGEPTVTVCEAEGTSYTLTGCDQPQSECTDPDNHERYNIIEVMKDLSMDNFIIQFFRGGDARSHACAPGWGGKHSAGSELQAFQQNALFHDAARRVPRRLLVNGLCRGADGGSTTLDMHLEMDPHLEREHYKTADGEWILYSAMARDGVSRGWFIGNREQGFTDGYIATSGAIGEELPIGQYTWRETCPDAPAGRDVPVMITCEGSGCPCNNVDADEQCLSWKEAGECVSNPGYMENNCREACELCDPEGDSSPDDPLLPESPMATVCAAAGEPYTLTGCDEQICIDPPNYDQYDINESMKNVSPTTGVFNIEFNGCAPGYGPNIKWCTSPTQCPQSIPCLTPGQPYSLIGCDAICTEPDTTGYDIKESTKNLSIADFNVEFNGDGCAPGYTGQANVVQPCGNPGDQYILSGCEPESDSDSDSTSGSTSSSTRHSRPRGHATCDECGEGYFVTEGATGACAGELCNMGDPQNATACCTLCSPIPHATPESTITCTTAVDSKFSTGDCGPGYNKDTSGAAHVCSEESGGTVVVVVVLSIVALGGVVFYYWNKRRKRKLASPAAHGP